MAKFLLLLPLLAVLNLPGHVESSEMMVDSVTQAYTPDTNKEIVKQIQMELQASYLYQAYASFYQRADVALPGIQKFFEKAALEEREHAQMLIDYVNMRGGYVDYKAIHIKKVCDEVATWLSGVFSDNTLCICGFLAQPKTLFNSKCSGTKRENISGKEGLMGFQDALAVEKYVNHKLLKLHAVTKDDVHFTHMLEHHLLDEQVKSINALGHYVTRLSSFTDSTYKLGEYMFDQKLK